jgi:hypothetical protein
MMAGDWFTGRKGFSVALASSAPREFVRLCLS